MAPAAGYVMAWGKLDLGVIAGANINVSLNIDMVNVSGDLSVTSQSHFGVAAVTSGQTVTVLTTVITTTDPATTGTYSVAALFVPVP